MAGNGHEVNNRSLRSWWNKLNGGVGTVIGAAIGATHGVISRMLVFTDFIVRQYNHRYFTYNNGYLFDALIQRYSSEKARRQRLSAKTACRCTCRAQ